MSFFCELVHNLCVAWRPSALPHPLLNNELSLRVFGVSALDTEHSLSSLGR
jgi:hypothetical protein